MQLFTRTCLCVTVTRQHRWSYAVFTAFFGWRVLAFSMFILYSSTAGFTTRTILSPWSPTAINCGNSKKVDQDNNIKNESNRQICTLYSVKKCCKKDWVVLQGVSALCAQAFHKVCMTNEITDNLNAQGISLLINFKSVLERDQTAFLIIHAGLLTYLDNAVHCKIDAV